jgi:hypothetical protein
MKKQVWLPVIAFAILVAVYAAWRQQSATHPSGDKLRAATNHVADQEPGAVRATNQTAQSGEGSSAGLPGQPPEQDLQDRKQRELLDHAFNEKNVPVSFFGKVVDQEGQPLANANVKLAVRQWHGPAAGNIGVRFNEHNLVTGQDGRFNLQDERGDSVSVKGIEKDGFELSGKSQLGFSYEGGTEPDPNSPVVYKMWKITAAEPLITGEKFYGMIPDGRTYTLDFLNGKKLEGQSTDGDIWVRIIRPASVQRREKFPWSYTIEAINGGVIETQDEFLYLAPESGYTERYEAKFDPSAADWCREVKRQFYLRLRGGQVFGRLEVEMFADYNGKSVFSVKSFVNPAGSRNLRFDPAAQPKPALYE